MIRTYVRMIQKVPAEIFGYATNKLPTRLDTIPTTTTTSDDDDDQQQSYKELLTTSAT